MSFIRRWRTMDLTALFLCFFTLSHSSCIRQELGLPNNRLEQLIGSVGTLEFEKESLEYWPDYTAGSIYVFVNSDDDELRFLAESHRTGTTHRRYYFTLGYFRSDIGFDYETRYYAQQLVGENNLSLNIFMSIIPSVNEEGDNLEWGNGLVAGDYLFASLGTDEASFWTIEPGDCRIGIQTSDRGFDSNYQPFDCCYFEEVDTPEGIVLEEVYVDSGSCTHFQAVYFRKGDGIVAFRDSFGTLWVFDRKEP